MEWRKRLRLLGEEFGLGRGGCSCGLAAGDADHAEDGQGRDSRTGNEDAVGVGREIGRSQLDAIVEEREQVIRNDPFEGFAVCITKANPEAIQFGTAEKGLALGFEVTVEFTDKIERADAFEG